MPPSEPGPADGGVRGTASNFGAPGGHAGQRTEVRLTSFRNDAPS